MKQAPRTYIACTVMQSLVLTTSQCLGSPVSYLASHYIYAKSCSLFFSFLQSLVYSRVAAMVRACQFKIDDTLQPEEIPFCGEATANKIKDIARTGTTSVLEAHRCHLLPWL